MTDQCILLVMDMKYISRCDPDLTPTVWAEVSEAARQGRIHYHFRDLIADAVETRLLACAPGRRPSIRAAVDVAIDAHSEARPI